MKKILIAIVVFSISLYGNAQSFIQGSVKKNADPAKIDIYFRPNYTSATGEYCLFLQFAVSIPESVASGVNATAAGANTFSNMGALTPITPYTETFGTPSTADDERIFGFVFANPALATQSWSNGTGFIGIVVTFSSSVAATEVRMMDLTNLNGGANSNTYFAIVSTAGDLTNYPDYFYSIPGFSFLGTYPSTDQWVLTGTGSACNVARASRRELRARCACH